MNELAFHNPAFVAYLHALVDLHALLIRELDDTPEADAIRDKTDTLWHQLAQIEQEELAKVSEFFYGIKAA